MDGEDHEWELSKENVQPLRRGRHIAALAAALHPDHNEEHINFITQQKNNFELELRTYSGDNPFSVWENYIKWTEQYFPKGGQDGQLMKLLERSLKEFQTDKRYTNDACFINMWIKFAYYSDDPLVVFSYMFDNGIGVNVASLFVEWALSLERQGDIKKADAIYMEGLNRCAEPKDLLLQRHQQFESRVARNITLQIAENQNPGMDMGEETEKRSALGRLKASGAAHKVGTVRTGNMKLGSAGSLKDNRSVAPKQLSSRAIPIFHDAENVLPTVVPQQSNEWQSLPVPDVDNRENTKKPGIWTDAKIKQRPGIAPSVAHSIPFQIHEDPESATHETPRKTTLINTQPLSSRKAGQTDILSNLRCPPASGPIMDIPMYQKDKIYNGLSEFSFEELRAANNLKLKKEKEAEAERLQKEVEQKLKEELMQRQLLEVSEKLNILQAQINGINFNRPADIQSQQQQNDIVQQPGLAHQLVGSFAPISENVQSTLEVQSKSQQSTTVQGVSQPLKLGSSDDSNSSFASNSFVTPTTINGSLNVNQGRPADSQGANFNPSLRTPIFNTASTYSSTSLSSFKRFQYRPPSQTDPTGSNNSFESSIISSEGNSILGPVSQANSSAVKNHTSTATPAPANSCITTPFGKGSQLENTFSHSMHGRAATPRSVAPTPENHTGFIVKGPLTAPSPTVYTKEALQCVMGMFSTSLSYDDHLMTEEVEPPSGMGATNCSTQIPFEIHEDTGNFKIERQSFKDASVKKGLQHFYIESDDAKENVLKASVQKPQTSACRQRLEIYCDEPQDKENEVKATNGKRSARRGLGFAIYDDVDMVDVDKEFQPMNSDFTIECQARYDTTLAPLDSFFVQAKAASTPCATALDKPRLKVQERGDTVSSCLTSSESTSNSIGESSSLTSHLSPIPEGSSDGSKEDTKSSHQSHITSKMFHSGNTQSEQNGIRDRPHDLMEAETETDSRDVSMHEDIHLDQDKSYHHQIDTTSYISPDVDEKTEAQLSTSICLDPKDPFDDNTIAFFLGNLSPSITEYPNFTACSGQMPDIFKDNFVCLDKLYISVDKCIGEGGYAKIYKITDHCIGGDDTISMDSIVTSDKVIKVQSPPCYWEFYVSCELRSRLAKLAAPMDVVHSVMEVDQGYFFENGSVIRMTYFPKGSLLNLVNMYKSDRCLLTSVEPFACLLTIELLHMFEQIHKCGFLHGDVKPDNFLLMGLPHIKEGYRSPQEVFGSRLRLVQLIDFGQSIDLTKFARGTTFVAKVVTSGFQCIEMRTDRPWTFQADLFGLVGTIHVVLFGSYMNVFQEKGLWRVTANYVRKWNVPLWKQLFNELLNIPSCDQQPDLPSIRREFEKYFMDNLIPAYNSWVQEIKNLEIASE